MTNPNPQAPNDTLTPEPIGNYLRSIATSQEKIATGTQRITIEELPSITKIGIEESQWKSLIDSINSFQLNNQEQGEWTPILRAGNNVLTIKNFPAIYFRIGRLVYYSCDLTVVQHPEVPNSSLEVDGLPYLSIDKHWQPGNVSFFRNIEIENNITSLVIPGTKKIRLYDNPNGESVGLKSDNLTEDSRIILSGSYVISHPQ